jgi:restriction system protein
MSVPDFQAFLHPLLSGFSDGAEHRIQDLYSAIHEKLGISAEDRRVLLPSGRVTQVENRIAWSRTYLKKAGLIEPVRRGIHRITETGSRFLRNHPNGFRVKDLKQIAAFKEWHSIRAIPESEPESGGTPAEPVVNDSPEEQIERAVVELNRALADELLERVRQCSPEFFERLVVQVLVAMGYGGSIADAGRAIGGSGDEGIDGVIKEDQLGLDALYIQAKRWSNPVGRPAIQGFVGALHGQRARKGIFITTSSFTKEAREYAASVETRVVLVDGPQLAQLMIERDVGVTTIARYSIKRVDSDFFEGE